MITTKTTENFPEIEWEITNNIIHKDLEERIEVFTAKGKDDKGNKYSGSAYYLYDEFYEIINIKKS